MIFVCWVCDKPQWPVVDGEEGPIWDTGGKIITIFWAKLFIRGEGKGWGEYRKGWGGGLYYGFWLLRTYKISFLLYHFLFYLDINSGLRLDTRVVGKYVCEMSSLVNVFSTGPFALIPHHGHIVFRYTYFLYWKKLVFGQVICVSKNKYLITLYKLFRIWSLSFTEDTIFQRPTDLKHMALLLEAYIYIYMIRGLP